MAKPHNLLRWTKAFCVCAAIPSAAHAGGLQVSPVSIEIPERAGLIWLSNEADTPLRAQVRVFRWSQEDNEDRYEATQDVLASPPFIEIEPGGKQVVRLVRFNQAAQNQIRCEIPYRIFVDELPDVSDEGNQGLRFRMKYSVPVYLKSPDCDEEEPSLAWSLSNQDDVAHLNVVNLGETRAQLGRVVFVDHHGKRTELSSGLLGYVLPNAKRTFALATPAPAFRGGGQLEVMLNGSQITEPLSLSAPGE